VVITQVCASRNRLTFCLKVSISSALFIRLVGPFRIAKYSVYYLVSRVIGRAVIYFFNSLAFTIRALQLYVNQASPEVVTNLPPPSAAVCPSI
jgi:hypothetical protein